MTAILPQQANVNIYISFCIFATNKCTGPYFFINDKTEDS